MVPHCLIQQPALTFFPWFNHVESPLTFTLLVCQTVDLPQSFWVILGQTAIMHGQCVQRCPELKIRNETIRQSPVEVRQAHQNYPEFVAHPASHNIDVKQSSYISTYFHYSALQQWLLVQKPWRAAWAKLALPLHLWKRMKWSELNPNFGSAQRLQAERQTV